jgi:hypothetical protein
VRARAAIDLQLQRAKQFRRAVADAVTMFFLNSGSIASGKVAAGWRWRKSTSTSAFDRSASSGVFSTGTLSGLSGASVAARAATSAGFSSGAKRANASAAPTVLQRIPSQPAINKENLFIVSVLVRSASRQVMGLAHGCGTDGGAGKFISNEILRDWSSTVLL